MIPKLRKQREQDQCVLGHPGFHETLSRVLHSLCYILTTLRLEHGFAGELSQGEAALSGVELSPPVFLEQGLPCPQGAPYRGLYFGVTTPHPPVGSFWAQALSLPGDAGALKGTVGDAGKAISLLICYSTLGGLCYQLPC